MRYYLTVTAIAVILIGCGAPTNKALMNNTDRTETTQKATLAGGCFWCLEAHFKAVNGVINVTSGYAGGDESNAAYNEVKTGRTDHREAIQITFDPNTVSYEALLDEYWKNIDPTDPGGQFNDRGPQYTTAIYYHDEDQRRIAEQTKQSLQDTNTFNDPIVTKIEPYTTFTPAEDEHQDYAENNTTHYKRYKKASGRDEYLNKQWDDYADAKQNLSLLERYVTQKNGTEPPYANTYYDHDEPGIYVDTVSGEPLFASTHKYNSGTGWPSFYKPLEPNNIVTKQDTSWLTPRTEVRSKHADSHLGHVFDDGPEPTGKRYCINSAALEFIHRDDLIEKGYEEYTSLFNETKNTSNDT